MQCYKLRGVALELTGINDFQNSINENEWDEDWGVIWHCHLTLLSILFIWLPHFLLPLFFLTNLEFSHESNFLGQLHLLRDDEWVWTSIM